MTTVVVNKTVDEQGLSALLEPRTDMLTEVKAGKGRFECELGPFEEYSRTVESEPRPGGTFDVQETTEFKLSIPVWWWAFVPLVKGAIRRPPAPGHVPWWSPPDKLDARAARILAYLCTFSAIAGYLGVLISQTNPYFQKEFGSSETEIANLATAVRIAGILALGITYFADSRGRRTVLVAATYIAILAAASGAVAPGLFWLGATQTVARACDAAIAVLIAIMAVEELPAGSRAFAVSVVTMTGAIGAGGVVVFLQVAHLATWAWRIFYAVPIALLLVMPRLARALPETRRFEVLEAHELHLDEHPDPPAAASAGRSDAQPDHNAHEPAGEDSPHPRATTPHNDDAHLHGGVVEIDSKRRRFAVLGASGFLFAIFFTPAAFYMNKWLINEQGYNGLQITLMQVLTNLPGGLAIVIGGKLADRHGRRLIGAAGVAAGVGFTVLMYMATGYPIWAFSALSTIFGAMSIPALGVYGPELFATSNRGLANGGINLLGVMGSVIGLQVAAHIAANNGGQYSTAIPILGLAPLLVVFIIMIFYPETAHRELEELNPEDEPPPRTLAELDELEHQLDDALAHEQAIHDHHLQVHPHREQVDRADPAEEASNQEPAS